MWLFGVRMFYLVDKRVSIKVCRKVRGDVFKNGKEVSVVKSEKADKW